MSSDSEITVLKLDPLDADGVGRLLRSEHQVADVDEFVQSAHLNGVGALLGNPLTLDLLARVVQGVGEWPRSRQETLERACRLLASEHNEEHRLGRGVVPRDTVMDAAGYLCALLLLAGMEGFSLVAGNGGTALVGIEDLSAPPGGLVRDALTYALSTKLFTADTGAERGVAPLHRQVEDDRSAALMLGVLRHAETPDAVSALAPDLLAIVRDEAVPSHLRTRALHAYVRVTSDDAEQAAMLGGLLAAIHAGSVSDPDDDLRGILLIELYPDVVGPSDVWHHMVVRSQDNYSGRLWAFADRVLVERSQDRHLAELLDAASEHAAELVPGLIESRLRGLPLRVLEKALSIHGEIVAPERLAGWLAVSSRSLSYSDEPSDAAVRAWLEQRPQIQKAVYLESLRTAGSVDDVDRNPFWHFWHSDVLHGSRLPPDFGRWCLDQALALEDTEPAVSLVLLGHAHAATEVSSMSEGLTIEMMRQRTRGHPPLERRLDELLQPPSSPPSDEERRREIEEHRRRMDEERKQRREEWTKALREHQSELWENRFSPPNLHSLAMTYLGLYSEDDASASPARRLSDFVGGDPELRDRHRRQ